MAHLIPRQSGSVFTDAYAGCTSYDYTAVDSCYSGAIGTAYPSCYDYLSDSACCTSWLGWENNYFSCLQTAYDNCFDFTSYEASVSAFLPCYSNSPFAGPQSVAAQTTNAASVPALVFETISTGPPTAAPTHSSIPSYNGQGNLLQGYCTAPDYVLLDGPTAIWAPLVGCVNEKSDCCPYAVQAATSTSATTVTVVATVTVDVGPDGSTQGVYAGLQAYPTPQSTNQATLAHCPGDYVSVSGGCCPSGYQLWNAPLGGEVPCYSSLSSFLVPPAVPVSNYQQQATVPGNVTAAASSTVVDVNQKATSAVVNVVFAVQFPVSPSSGLSTGAKAGIGVGASLGGIAIIALAFSLIWRSRKHKKDKQALTATQQAEGQAANGQSQNGMTEAVPSPYAYSQRTDIQTDGGPQLVQTPGGFVPQEQNGYFQQQPMHQGQNPQYYGQQAGPQMQQGLAPAFYAQQPGQPMQQVYGQQPMQGPAPVQYPSPVSSAVSPQPTGSDSYGQQTGYAGAIPPSTGSPPPQGAYGNQTGYAAPMHELSPNSTGYGAPGSATFVSPTSTGSPTPAGTHDYQGGYNPPGSDPNHPPAQELHGQNHPPAQELQGQNPPGEMRG